MRTFLIFIASFFIALSAIAADEPLECGTITDGIPLIQRGPVDPCNHVTRVNVAFECDYEYYVAQGRSATACESAMVFAYNGAKTIFLRDLNIELNAVAFIVNTNSDDGYTGTAEDSFGQIRNKWISNGWQAIYEPHAIQLFTGRAISSRGSFAGISDLRAICRPAISAVVKTSLGNSTIGLTTHELGHSFGAIHDQDCVPAQNGVMRSGNGIGGVLFFSSCSIATINGSLPLFQCINNYSCCVDINNDGIKSVQDLFDFLALYFARDPRSDFNRDLVYSIQDVFDYLNCYLGD